MDMRDRMERLVVLPFTMGCVSQSSVSVGGATQLKKPKSEQNPPVTRRKEGEERPSGLRLKASFRFPSRIQKLIRTTLKSFSHLFVYKEMEMEMEMEIGFPTDVKHVTHIGWDGSSTNPIKGWENLRTPELLANFPTISLRQFELAMAAQAHDPLLVTSSKLI
ncbi:hypothetical protein PVL29_006577 [Vitis rotundifolia]|uniref:CRIB domain-containing protein n=1 Tax=Vitis rotundifolia TaxID=103349 RepID=A0AA39A6F0_VITRO|nr:hypothetical protein PVL29_006577 [Vitis rotundifolia]